jgi:NitT/TauT family transport system ATP-binding protein
MQLEINNLSKKYLNKIIIDNFSLNFPETGTVCLFGPSGCGKTTLLNCIAGLVPFESGKVLMPQNSKISYVFQEDRLIPWITISKNISEVIKDNKVNACAKAEHWIKLVGLTDELNRFPSQLSGGMRQRVSIARALAFSGELFLLDEPFHALDYKSKLEMIKLIKQNTEHSLKILVTHDINEAKMLADVIYILSGPPIKIIDKIIKLDE